MDKYGTKQLHSTVQENNLQLLSIPDPIESYCIYIYIPLCCMILRWGLSL